MELTTEQMARAILDSWDNDGEHVHEYNSFVKDGADASDLLSKISAESKDLIWFLWDEGVYPFDFHALRDDSAALCASQWANKAKESAEYPEGHETKLYVDIFTEVVGEDISKTLSDAVTGFEWNWEFVDEDPEKVFDAFVHASDSLSLK